MALTPLQLVGLVALVVAAYFLPRLVRGYVERWAQRQRELLRARQGAEEKEGGRPPRA